MTWGPKQSRVRFSDDTGTSGVVTSGVADAVREKFKRLRVGPSMKRQFNRFDDDGNGRLDKDEFRKVRGGRCGGR